ncbi:conserved hypothetical protein [Culex quinquefasciatus]|uniref:Uncharacterized protein n=1 Tax=Culex quinquefasciatus TaxID=7176 RepID=B0X826_CULQU|nr:conserved hypothetical protein [Culex quinquefasciatus]|eukprot:XP_001865798.1 conserved hypothetical protein [Culex quinquefasciatus]
MEVLLEDKGLLHCVQAPLDLAGLAELESDSANDKQRKRALRAERVAKDRSCRNLLVNRIAEDQLDHVKDARSAKETWDALRDVFERVGIAGKLFLKKQFQELRLVEGGDVQAFLLQFEKLLRELKAAEQRLTWCEKSRSLRSCDHWIGTCGLLWPNLANRWLQSRPVPCG